MISPTSEPVPTALEHRKDLLAKTAPLIFLVLWSAGFGFAKVGLEHAGPMTLLAWRYGLVVAILAPAFLVSRPRLPASRAAWLHLIVVGTLIQFVYFGLGLAGMSMGVSAGIAAIIASLQPIVVSLASPTMLGERITKLKWIGIILGMAGAMIVIAARSEISLHGSIALPLCFGSMLAMAAATLFQKRFGTNEHVVTSNLIQYTTGFLLVLPFSLLLEDATVNWSRSFVFALAYLVVANSLVAISLFFFMLHRGEASRVSSLFFLIPPTAALSGWVLLGETLTMATLAGMSVAAIGIALVMRPG